jgi:hypothetical protein
MSKQNLNPSSWPIWHTNNNLQKRIRNEKVLHPKVKGIKNLKKNQTTEHYKGSFSNTQKIPCMLLLDFKDDLEKFRWHSYNTLNRLK